MKIKRIQGYSLLELTIIIGIAIIMITITKPYIESFIKSLRTIKILEPKAIEEVVKLIETTA